MSVDEQRLYFVANLKGNRRFDTSTILVWLFAILFHILNGLILWKKLFKVYKIYNKTLSNVKEDQKNEET